MPVLKTERDDANECAVAARLSERHDFVVYRLDQRINQPDFDFLLYAVQTVVRIPTARGDWHVLRNNGPLLGAVELKTRHGVSFTDYPTVPVSKAKAEKLRRVQRRMNVPAIFAVWYQQCDSLVWIAIDDAVVDENLGIITRTKARDSGLVGANDREPGYYVPRERFRDVAELHDWLMSWSYRRLREL